MIVGKICVRILFVVLLLLTFVTFVEGQTETEEEPPREAELSFLNLKKMNDIRSTCLDIMDIVGINSTLGDQCYALFTSHNEHMKQLFNANKEAIDNILYG